MKIRLVVCAAIMFLAAGVSQASLLVPSGLQPGDQYQLAFVTRHSARNPNYYSVDPDAIVQAEANGSPLLGAGSVSYRAIISRVLSGPGQDPAKANARDWAAVEDDTTNPAFMGVFNLNDQLVATGFGDMWDGSISAPIAYSGGYGPQPVIPDGTRGVWTNTLPSGSNVGNFAVYGINVDTSGAWTAQNYTNPVLPYRFYGLSEVLTVPTPEPEPVPEPASVITWALLGTVGCIGTWWNRRRKAG